MSESAGNKRPFSNMHSIDEDTKDLGDVAMPGNQQGSPVPATVPNLTSDKERRDYIQDNRVPADSSVPVEYVSSQWLASLDHDAPVEPAIRALGAAGEQVALPVFQALEAWYGVDESKVALRVATEGSDDRIAIQEFGWDTPLGEIGQNLRVGVIYSSYIVEGAVRQARKVSISTSASTVRDLDLNHNETLIVMEPQPEREIGRVGLGNMGNTCFMNSSLQALLHIPELVAYFGSGDYQRDLNRTNPIGCQGLVADAFARLVQQIYSEENDSSIRPWDFRATIGRFNRSFANRMQQDSQEFTAFLLDSLHEDLNRVHNKPATEKPELKEGQDPYDSAVVSELASQSWKTHKLRNDSPIVDLFTGMYKSTLVCPVCSKVSITFDPFFDLTLPLPRNSAWLKSVKIVPVSTNDRIISTEVALTPNSIVGDMRDQIGGLLSVPGSDLIVSDVFDHKFYRLISDKEILSASIDQADEIVLYESPTKAMVPVEQKPVAVYLRYNDMGTGVPFFIFIESLDKVELEAQIRARIIQIHGESAAEAISSLKINVFPGSIDEISYGYGGLRLRPLYPPSSHDEGLTEDHKNNNDNDEDNGEPFEKIELFDKMDSAPTNQNHAYQTNNDGHTSTVSSPSPLSSPSTASQSSVPSIDSPLSSSFDPRHDQSPPDLSGDLVLVVDVDSGLDGFVAPSLAPLTNAAAEEARAAMQHRKEFTLEDSLRSFEQPEVLGDNDLWYCPRCKEFRKAEKQLELWRAPDVLMIHLKRFSGAHSMAHKIDDHVKFPLMDLDLQRYISDSNPNKDGSECVYDLFAVDNHFGGMGGGHYTAYVHDPFSDPPRWLDFNDSHVSPIDESRVCSPAAYLLFYRRRKAGVNTREALDVVHRLKSKQDKTGKVQDTPRQNSDNSEGDSVFVGEGQRLGSASTGESSNLPWANL